REPISSGRVGSFSRRRSKGGAFRLELECVPTLDVAERSGTPVHAPTQAIVRLHPVPPLCALRAAVVAALRSCLLPHKREPSERVMPNLSSHVVSSHYAIIIG